jgi:DNA-binding NtrC family response regulator
MKTSVINIFILNDSTTIAYKLRRFFQRRFGNQLNVSLFFNSEPFLNNLNEDVHVVILDDYLYDPITNTGVNVAGLVKKIKEKNNNTEVIILSSERGIKSIINATVNGYIHNKHGAWRKLQIHLDKIINNPINFLEKEFEVGEFIGIFTLIFLNMGIASILALRFFE